MTGGTGMVAAADLLTLAQAWEEARNAEYQAAIRAEHDGRADESARAWARADVDHWHAVALRRLCGR